MNRLPKDTAQIAAEYRNFINSIADEFQISVEEVLTLYEQELMTLRSTARVTAYLSVLTTKHVRDALHEEKRSREQ